MSGTKIFHPVLYQQTQDPSAYIYKVEQILEGQALVFIQSNDTLTVLDCDSLSQDSAYDQSLINWSSQLHKGITCLERDSIDPTAVLTAGNDGLVYECDGFNKISQNLIEYPGNKCIDTLALSPSYIACGTSFDSEGDRTSSIAIWDRKSPDKPFRQFSESHSDDITALHLHPQNDNLLLSGGADGLLNVFDTRIEDEDDAVIEAIPHGSSIYKAGWLTEDWIYGLGDDHKFSIYPFNIDTDATDERSIQQFGDLRDYLSCDYIIGIASGFENPVIAAGTHGDDDANVLPKIDLFRLLSKTKSGKQDGQITQWTIDRENPLRLMTGQNKEVVRSICVVRDFLYAGGEDGCITGWSLGERPFSRQSADDALRRSLNANAKRGTDEDMVDAPAVKRTR